MSKLSKAVKLDLINRAATTLFFDKLKALGEKTGLLIEKVVNSHEPFKSCNDKLSQMSDDERKCLYFGNSYDVNKIENPCTQVNYYLGEKKLIQSKRLHSFPETEKGVRVRTYSIESEHFQTDGSRLSIKQSSPFFEEAKSLRDEYKAIFKLINDIEQVVSSVSTAKQLEDLSPQLYAMLPNKAVSTALIPADSLCRVNELLSGK